MNRRQKIRLVILSVLLLLAVFSVWFVFKEDRRGVLTVAFLNVGQGDAIFIDSPSGNQMLIDGGPGKAVLRELGSVIPFYDRSIDFVLESHADQDHVGGIPDVLNKYNVKYFVESGVPGDSSSYEEAEKIVSDRESVGKIKKVLAKRGMEIDFGDGVILQILFPQGDVANWETNRASIIVKLVYGENEFLFTGDSPQAIENYLVSLENQSQTLVSDVLKVGHHGSKTSTSEEFVKAVKPQYAVISVGKDNRYGHPNKETLDTLQKLKTQILRTDELGRVIFKSDGTNLSEK